MTNTCTITATTRILGAIVFTTAAVAALAGAGSAIASADVPPATPSPTGDDIVPVGDLGVCGGPIHIDRDTDRGRPGYLGITATPRGGLGASPQCATTIQVDWLNGIAPFAHSIQQPIDHGAVHIDVPAGAGVSMVTVSIVPQRAFARVELGVDRTVTKPRRHVRTPRPAAGLGCRHTEPRRRGNNPMTVISIFAGSDITDTTETRWATAVGKAIGSRHWQLRTAGYKG